MARQRIIESLDSMDTARVSSDSLESSNSALPRIATESNGHNAAEHWADFARIGLVALALAVSRTHLVPEIAGVDVLGLAAALIGGYPVFRAALEHIVSLRMTMELSMTIALIAALSIGQIFTADVIILFVLAAEHIEEMTIHRGRRAVGELVGSLPDTAEVIQAAGSEGGSISVVPTATLKSGDIVLVRPGQRVPVDGVVREGHSFVDQSAITGELTAIEAVTGTTVYAGSVNQNGALQIRTSGPGSETVFGRMSEALRKAGESQAPVQKLADRLSGYLVYFALACALLTFALTRDSRATIAVIIVAGACGIAAGTPLAILGGLGQAARIGVIVKGGSLLEKLATIDTLVFDKTGTLTLGDSEVVDIDPAHGIAPIELLTIAARAELFSEHPLARAILRRAAPLTLVPPKEFAYHPGKGVTCLVDGQFTVAGSRAFLREMGVRLPRFGSASDGCAEVAVAQAGQFAGSIFIAEVIRPGARTAVARLRKLGMQLVMMTGGTAAAADSLAGRLGFQRALANLLPEEKVDQIRILKRKGKRVAMIGDGVNDAPALAAADVPIAMGSAADVAQHFAGVLLIGDDLARLADLMEIARRCRRTVMFNFAGTLLVDAVGIGLAAFGLLSPIVAAMIHVGSETLFILNSARLLPLHRGTNRARL